MELADHIAEEPWRFVTTNLRRIVQIAESANELGYVATEQERVELEAIRDRIDGVLRSMTSETTQPI